MSSKDDPGRDKARPADPGQPKKPYATLDLKATEVPSQEPPAPANAKPSETDKAKEQPSTAGSSVPGIKSGGIAGSATPGAASAPSTSAARTDAGKPAEAARGAAAASPARQPQSQAAAAAPSQADPAPRRGGVASFLSHLAAAIVGGLIVLFGAEQMVQTLGLSPDLVSGGPGAAQLQQRIAALEAQGRGNTTASGEVARKLADGEARLARLEEQARALADLGQTASRIAGETKALQERIAQAAPDDLGQRMAKLEETLATLAAAGQSDQAGRIPQLAALTARIRELETAIASQTAALRRDLTQALETRTQQASEAGEVARSATQRIDRDLSSVRTETATLTQRVEALKADSDRLAATLRVVQEETGQVRSAVDGLKGDIDSRLKSVARPNDVTAALAPVTGKLAELEQGLQGVIRSEADRRTNAERIVLSLELANLKRVLDRGQRYEAELAEVKKVAGGKIDLAPLERYKSEGVPTVVELARAFRPVASAILDAEAEPVEGGVMDRLLAGAKSIVRVRKMEPAAGDKSPEAVVARMEAALKDGRLGNVLDEVKNLSPRAAGVAREWLEKVEARHSIDRALAAVESQLKSSLGGGRAQN